MAVNREELKRMIDIIPERDALELYNYLDFLNTKREKEYINSLDINLLSEDESLVNQIMKSRENRSAGRIYTREEGLEYLQQKRDSNNG